MYKAIIFPIILFVTLCSSCKENVQKKIDFSKLVALSEPGNSCDLIKTNGGSLRAPTLEEWIHQAPEIFIGTAESIEMSNETNLCKIKVKTNHVFKGPHINEKKVVALYNTHSGANKETTFEEFWTNPENCPLKVGKQYLIIGDYLHRKGAEKFIEYNPVCSPSKPLLEANNELHAIKQSLLTPLK